MWFMMENNSKKYRIYTREYKLAVRCFSFHRMSIYNFLKKKSLFILWLVLCMRGYIFCVLYVRKIDVIYYCEDKLLEKILKVFRNRKFVIGQFMRSGRMFGRFLSYTRAYIQIQNAHIFDMPLCYTHSLKL